MWYATTASIIIIAMIFSSFIIIIHYYCYYYSCTVVRQKSPSNLQQVIQKLSNFPQPPLLPHRCNRIGGLSSRCAVNPYIWMELLQRSLSDLRLDFHSSKHSSATRWPATLFRIDERSYLNLLFAPETTNGRNTEGWPSHWPRGIGVISYYDYIQLCRTSHIFELKKQFSIELFTKIWKSLRWWRLSSLLLRWRWSNGDGQIRFRSQS